jgi:hypothetical protein
VRYEGVEASELPDHRIVKELHAHDFLQIAAAPPVVVAAEECDGKACCDHVAKHAQCPIMTPCDAPFVLEPEVEDVAVQHHRGRLIGGLGQPGEEGLFVLRRRGAQMDVGGDEYGAF